VVGTTQHEGAVELIPAVAPMGIAINYYILFVDFSVGRSGGSTENPGKGSFSYFYYVGQLFSSLCPTVYSSSVGHNMKPVRKINVH
jgi:hypothetical protein